LSSAFRSLRFGINEAHGSGVAIQLNTLLDAGAVKIGSDGTFSVVHDKIRTVVTELTQQLMTIQARGNYNEARHLIDTLGVLRPEVATLLKRLSGLPIDIKPRYITAEKLSKP
jgi:hypothetical protein